MFQVRRKSRVLSVCLKRFEGRIRPGQVWTGCWRKLILLAWQNVERQWSSTISLHINFGKHQTCGEGHLHWKVLCTFKEKSVLIEREMYILRSSVQRIAEHDILLKICQRLSGYGHLTGGTTLFGASAIYTVVWWHKLGEVKNECTSHNSIVLAICLPKIIKFAKDLPKFRQKQVGKFFWPTLYLLYSAISHFVLW